MPLIKMCVKEYDEKLKIHRYLEKTVQIEETPEEIKQNLYKTLYSIKLEMIDEMYLASFMNSIHYKISHSMITSKDEIFSKIEEHGITFTVE